MIKKIFSLSKFVIPIILLFIVFSKVNFQQIFEIIKNSNMKLLAFILLNLPIYYIIFCLRWKLLMKFFWNSESNLIDLLKTFYKGFFIGYFLPASVGLDTYRILNYNKKDKQYGANISIIVIEKISSLLAACILIVFLGLFVDIPNQSIDRIIDFGYIILSVFIFFVLIILLFRKNKNIHKLIVIVESYFIAKISGLFRRLYPGKVTIDNDKAYIRDFFKPLMNIKFISTSLIFSLIIHSIGAFFGMVLFRSLGADVPYFVNLFCSPLLTIVLLLPISFGGIGIRESSYIFLYNLFGVPKEIGLLASLVIFFMIILNAGYGGLLMFYENIRKIKAMKYNVKN